MPGQPVPRESPILPYASLSAREIRPFRRIHVPLAQPLVQQIGALFVVPLVGLESAQSPYSVPLVIDDCNSFDFNERFVLKEARNLKKRHRRIVSSKKRAMRLPQLLEMSQVVIAVTHKNIEFGNVLHLTACRLDDLQEIMQNLLILCNNIPRREDSTLRIASRLPRQEEQPTTACSNSVTESYRTRQRRRVNNLFFHA